MFVDTTLVKNFFHNFQHRKFQKLVTIIMASIAAVILLTKPNLFLLCAAIQAPCGDVRAAVCGCGGR